MARRKIDLETIEAARKASKHLALADKALGDLDLAEFSMLRYEIQRALPAIVQIKRHKP